MFFYSDNGQGSSGAIDFSRIDAVKQYMKHYDNGLILSLYMANGTVVEKAQARKEMSICERKMKFWERQANFNWDRCLVEIDKSKKLWSGPTKRVA